MKHLHYLIGLLLLLNACKNKKETPVVTTPEESYQVVTIQNPSSYNSQLPRLFSNGKELYFSWVTRTDSLDVLNYAVYADEQWWNETEVAHGSNWFVNWADFPAIAANNGYVLTNFLQKSATGTYTYDVKLNLYRADIHATLKDFILHDDKTQSEHGFVSMLPWQDDSFFVTWLDGRNTIGEHDGHQTHGAGGAMTLRGAFVNNEGNILDDTQLDGRICDCCQTSAALTQNGPVVVYRDRSEEEIRDISIVRLQDGKWTEPKTIGNDLWKIAGCPVNGPSIDALENIAAVAWFTAANEEGQVNVAFSNDNGATFGKVIRIDAGNATGRVDIVVLSKNEAAVSWMEPEGYDEVIRLIKVSSDGKKSTPITISKTSPERASGFPQLEVVNGELVMAWTVLDESGATSIQFAKIN